MSKKPPRGERPSRARKGRYQPPSIERLRELFEIRGGVLFDRRTGQPARTWRIDKTGYRRVAVAGRLVRVHRVVVAIRDGAWPKVVHHIDGDPGNNHADNLIAANAQHNARAKGHGRNSPTGRPGIRITPDGKYRAGAKVKPVRTKTFDDWGDADQFVTAQEKALGWPPRPWRRATFKQALRRRQPLPRTLDWFAKKDRDDE